MPEGVTARLCRRIVDLRDDRLDAVALAAARLLVLDGLAVGVAGSQEQPIGLLVDHARSLGTTPAATVLGHDLRTDVVSAAAINGAALHVLDFEPMWSPSNHALSTTLPVALALAEITDAGGAEVLRALVHGIELQGWLRVASRQWAAADLRFHPPGLVGPLGAAVTAAQLLGLDAEQLGDALGIAASRSGGLMANVGTMTKATHCGHAAAAGLEAALLAKRGFTANPDILDAPLGFGEAFSSEFATEEVLGFGPPYRLVRPGFVVKRYPSQFGTHFGISAALRLRERLLQPERITAVRLTVPVMRYVDRSLPATGLDGKFSLQYTTAAALLDARVDRHTFSDGCLHRPALQALLARTELLVDENIGGRFEEMHVLLEVDLDDGTTLSQRSDDLAGGFGPGTIGRHEHLTKVRDCLGVTLDEPAVERTIAAVDRFEQLPNATLRAMLGELAPTWGSGSHHHEGVR
ncbi:MAG: MmgE/PrpD family protein [Acidimicrobiales bacterium]